MCSQKLLVLFAICLSFNLCFSTPHGAIIKHHYHRNRLLKQHHQRIISVEDFGAISDDRDNSNAFEKAWNATCSQGLTLVVPENKIYYLKQTTFYGPCQSNTAFEIYGTMKAWGDMSEYEEDRRHWIVFNGVKMLRIEGGGTIDGNGQIWWQHSCKVNESLPCKEGPTAVTFHECNKLRVTNLNFKDAQQMHLSFQKCFDVKASHLKVVAPEYSPNTDGIHITETVMIRIAHSQIGTGDDCISIVGGSRNVTVTNITCGPGHGISIGSLGAHHSEDEVSNVEVNGAILTATANGARIKTWQGGSGYAKNIMFENIKMYNVSQPIIIDQYYCDQNEPCQEEDSAVEVSNIVYKNISGTSASEVAINFNCSNTVPCKAISLQNVDLKPEGDENEKTKAPCENVRFRNVIEFNPQCSFD